MSLPSTIIGRWAGQSRPSSLSICSNCLRNIYGNVRPQQQQIRGKKTMLPKATSIKVRLLKDIPQYGPKGSIMMVAPGRMRSIWYQRGEAEYLTRDLEKSIGKYTVVDRDPAYKPAVSKTKILDGHYNFLGEFIPTKVKEKLLTAAESVSILSQILPPSIRFYRATKTPTSIELHGSVSNHDIAQAIKMIAGASGHPDGRRIVVNAENIAIANDTAKLKQLGSFAIDIGFKGDQGWVKRFVSIEREVAGVEEITETAAAATPEDTPPALSGEGQGQGQKPVKLFSTPPSTSGSKSKAGSDQFIL